MTRIMEKQLQLLVGELPVPSLASKQRHGAFVDNMSLPVHRWFRYSAGFSAQWAANLIAKIGLGRSSLALDPFAGSGTLLLAADQCHVPSVGIEAHPFVARIARTKLQWKANTDAFARRANAILRNAKIATATADDYPELVLRCFSLQALAQLTQLRKSWETLRDDTAESELTWLAITTILRPTSSVGTAPWQYILPKKAKRVVVDPWEAFETQVQQMQMDMALFQSRYGKSQAAFIQADARDCPQIESYSVDAVITSPPYANNYDYADATRFEMSFWGDVQSWGDLHDAVRKNLIVSSSQHASIEKLDLDKILGLSVVRPIASDLEQVCRELALERLSHGGKKHYHTMIAAYFADMGKTLIEMRRVCKLGARLFMVIGDSAPYGVYVPVYAWLGRLAVAAGFESCEFEKIRDRNVKWKNRKHRVPLSEGILQIQG